ncbi:MAG: CRISPR-associated helicase Cas3', partial [Alphaproteobacteria bacterium]
MTLSYLAYWGKARPADGAAAGWHPLPYHALDVAAVGTALLEADPHLRRWLSGLLGLTEKTTVRLLKVVLALHDLGKFASAFQALNCEHYLARTSAAALPRSDLRHDAAGQVLWKERLAKIAAHLVADESQAGRWARALTPLLRATFGHHGRPCDDKNQRDVGRLFKDGAEEDALLFCRDVVALFSPGGLHLEGKSHEERFRLASWPVAGFVTLCDWIGSHQPTFPYHAPELALADYWQSHALPKAREAVARVGIVPAGPAPGKTFRELFPAIEQPTALQSWAEGVPMAPGPNLFLIEDLTGSGKTEAALMLAHRLVSGGHAVGLFDALPTQATATAMYERLSKTYRALFAGDDPSLVLSHGARDMHEGFRHSILSEVGDAGDGAYGDAGDREESTASAACAAWIAADRRRAMLADVGVGTVDQTILSVLPVRHQALRLLGLGRRVLLLDEVHAYDAYVSREIEELLRFQAALGGSVILLSATLPAETRRKLLDAFVDGRRLAGAQTSKVEELSNDYPLVTHICDRGADNWSPDANARSTGPRAQGRKVPVRMTDDRATAVEKIVRGAEAGASVCWVRNTVADAREAYEELRGRLAHVRLFHSRFTIEDRMRIEGEVVHTFGPDSSPDRRAGRVLVATQVVEQSLDLDFDVMISDLAPIDLLIQRAGRLQRHPRGVRPAPLELLVLGPLPHDEADENWYRRAFPRAALVYPDHGRLWLTARELKERGALDLPAESRALIDSVYTERALER